MYQHRGAVNWRLACINSSPQHVRNGRLILNCFLCVRAFVRYVSAPLSSWVDQKMTHYWEWAVTLLPMWLASVCAATRKRARETTKILKSIAP
jgi:hypothetical protein